MGFDRINAVLPDELILEIFRHVESKPSRDACSLVCKRWLGLERLSRDTIRIGASATPDSLVKLLSSRFPNIRYVFIDERLSISLPVQYGKRRRISRTIPSIGRFHDGSDQSVVEMDGIATSCLSDSGLGAVGDSFVKLEKLSLIWCSSVTDLGLRSFAEKCKSLKSLIYRITENASFLEDLNLRFCEGLTDTGLVRLVLGCGRTLRSLGVAACVKITDISLEAVGSHCRSLESLSLDSEIIQNKGLLAVAKGCSLLKVLKLQSINITDEACKLLVFSVYHWSYWLYTASRNLQTAAGCPELMHIEVNGCHNIGTDGLKSIGKFCAIGDDALISIGQGCSLQHLNVSGCHQIGDAGIIAIARGCPQLNYLDVSVLQNRSIYTYYFLPQNLGDNAMMELGEGCPLLKDIVISHCRQITDIEAGVATMVTTCSRIKKVLVEKWKVSARTKRRAGSIINYLCVDL
ncbi:F-box/LRR-repeat protein 4 [Sesamum angolense]|uniref:F-box/LRR-repeat protein 4 n=1 Tax=Sesamum angolense TaxID=2727404 RepID=A0AAE1X5R9_9LAMI|nr:F-box/LRR-repeat protein 4 [Sesamum angolense]